MEQQLDRARADRLTALRVAHAATAKVRALEAEPRGGAGAHGSSPGTADPGIAPDTIDAYLAEQGARPDRLTEALGELRVPTASAFDGTTRRMLTTSLVRALVRLPSLSDAAGRGLATRLLADQLGVPLPLVFLERIALAAGSELADGLRRWNDRHAGRLGLGAELTAVRAGLLSDHAA
ncbi:hypothetical protein Q5530_22525 [Saccharothrix sp. BKS2]|uniref:hypothetical protein n=1 Tax=Saccharothrix sp. BKS2 TaxID=3064400 RepID=UPI0039EBFB9B